MYLWGGRGLSIDKNSLCHTKIIPYENLGQQYDLPKKLRHSVLKAGYHPNESILRSDECGNGQGIKCNHICIQMLLRADTDI